MAKPKVKPLQEVITAQQKADRRIENASKNKKRWDRHLAVYEDLIQEFCEQHATPANSPVVFHAGESYVAIATHRCGNEWAVSFTEVRTMPGEIVKAVKFHNEQKSVRKRKKANGKAN